MRTSMVMGLGLALSLASVAAAQQPGQDARPKREHGARAGEHGMRGPEGRRGGPDGLLLKGIELTEGQRTQIAQLRKSERDSMDARRAQARKEFEVLREARQRGDTAAVRAEMVKRRQAIEQERAQRIAAIRNVLTVEQRVQFDKNVTELQQKTAERGARKADRPARGFGRGR